MVNCQGRSGTRNEGTEYTEDRAKQSEYLNERFRKNRAEAPHPDVHEATYEERILFLVEMCRPGGAVSLGEASGPIMRR